MRWMVLVFAMLGTACADLGPLGSVHPGPSQRPLTDKNLPPDTSDGPSPAPADPEPYWPVRIISADARIHMPSFSLGSTNEMRLVGEMRYDAHHAEIGASLAISGPDAIGRTFVPSQRSTNSFWGNSHWAEWTHYLRSGCGNAIFADFSFRAWLIGPGGWILDPHLEGRQVRAVQGNCPTSSGGPSGPGDSGGGGTLRCYTLVEHHYEYDPVTGESRYLYTTEEYLGCQYIS